MKLKVLAHFLFIWSACMIAWLFLDLIWVDEVIVREPRIWLRILETLIAFFVLGFSIGMFIGFIKNTARHIKTRL